MRADKSRRADAGASAPSMNDRLRPWLLISRRTISSRPPASSKIASMVASGSPVRTRSAEARAPRGRPKAPNGNGFPGARLPRQHIEPRFELDLDGFDHRQVADAEETQHARGTAIVSYI